MFKRILVPIDGSDSAERALDLAAEIAGNAKAKLSVMHVLGEELPPDLEHFAEVEHIDEKRAPVALGQRIVDGAKARAKEQAGVRDVETLVVGGDPAEQIVAAAKDADLIVMGTRGLGAAKGLLLGSVSHKVQQLAECPCMTTK